MNLGEIRRDWTRDEIRAIYEMPFADLIFQAQTIHRQHFDANTVQTCTLFSIKTGACPEDCGYCSQSGHHKTGLKKEKNMSVEEVVEAASKAKAAGATRFCMSAAWRHLFAKDVDNMTDLIKAVKELGMETCMTLGMLTEEQAKTLSDAGLDYYNHNLDSSPEYYPEITTTRTYQERLDTLDNVRKAGMKTCCGGIMGLGEKREDRIGLLHTLVNLKEHPKSVPINKLIPVPGTPLANSANIDPLEFIRTIATARIIMPQSFVRLSAGRTEMTDEMQALCFLAGANSIFLGDKLLTQANPSENDDMALFSRLGIEAMSKENLTVHA